MYRKLIYFPKACLVFDKAYFDIFTQTKKLQNGKPSYMRLGNPRVSLGFSNATNYPTPWTMWGLPVQFQETHIGNVKLGPAGTKCPELSTVS